MTWGPLEEHALSTQLNAIARNGRNTVWDVAAEAVMVVAGSM